MAIDTRDKRASIIGIDRAFGKILPNPNGSIDANDRQQLAGKYSGIAAAPPPTGGIETNLPRLNVG